MTFRIRKAMLKPPLLNNVHRVVMPPAAKINERMIVAHPQGVAVFFGVDDAEQGADQQAARYLMVFTTGQPVGTPVEGELNYLTTLVTGRMEVAGKLLVPGQPQQPRLVVEELHVFEFTPKDAAQVEALGKDRGDGEKVKH